MTHAVTVIPKYELHSVIINWLAIPTKCQIKTPQPFNLELFANFSSGDAIDLQVISPSISARSSVPVLLLFSNLNLIFGGLTEAVISLQELNLI